MYTLCKLGENKSPALHLATGLKRFRLNAPEHADMLEVGKMF